MIQSFEKYALWWIDNISDMHQLIDEHKNKNQVEMKELKYSKGGGLSRPLVSIKAGQAEAYQEPVTARVEAAFRIPGYRGLWLEANSWNREAADFLASRTARTPGDLRNHIQRINHQIKQKNPDGVYGALLDLFIVLKDRGRPLKARMLKSARPLLRKECFEQLHRRLDRGISELDAMPLSCTSVLSKGYTGSHMLVEKIDSESAHDWDPLQEARSHLEYSQVDEARSVLEKAVYEGSLRQDIHADLLEIYRRTNDKTNFLKMHLQLDIKNISVLHLWYELEAFFEVGE